VEGHPGYLKSMQYHQAEKRDHIIQYQYIGLISILKPLHNDINYICFLIALFTNTYVYQLMFCANGDPVVPGASCITWILLSHIDMGYSSSRMIKILIVSHNNCVAQGPTTNTKNVIRRDILKYFFRNVIRAKN